MRARKGGGGVKCIKCVICHGAIIVEKMYVLLSLFTSIISFCVVLQVARAAQGSSAVVPQAKVLHFNNVIPLNERSVFLLGTQATALFHYKRISDT